MAAAGSSARRRRPHSNHTSILQFGICFAVVKNKIQLAMLLYSFMSISSLHKIFRISDPKM